MRKSLYSFPVPYLQFGIIAQKAQRKTVYHGLKPTDKNSERKSKSILEENALSAATTNV